MLKPFPNREIAGLLLTNHLVREDLFDVVVAIPRGGVPVAVAVCRKLCMPLRICATARIAFGNREKLSVGSISDSGVARLDQYMINFLGVSQEALEAATETSLETIARLARELAPWQANSSSLEGKRLLVVDDAIATGISVLGAVEHLVQFKPRSIAVAAPVISSYASAVLLDRKISCHSVFTAEGSQFKPHDHYVNFEPIDLETCIAQLTGSQRELLVEHEGRRS